MFSATSHGKGVVDGICDNVKSVVRCQVMSIKKDSPIIQDSESLAELSKKLVPSKNKYFSDEEIANCKKTNLLRKSVSVHGIFKFMSTIFCQIFIFSPNESPLKTMKKVYCFIKKALFVLEIFKFL